MSGKFADLIINVNSTLNACSQLSNRDKKNWVEQDNGIPKFSHAIKYDRLGFG